MIGEIFSFIFILFFSVVFHECAHGYVAYLCGDPTAKLAGRLTLNPFKHVDFWGTFILPGILILLRFLGMGTIILGWAKPVPVNFLRLRHPKRDMMMVALAGPMVNILLAIFCAQALKWNFLSYIVDCLGAAIFINLLLAFFNLVPIPPLDGSRLVMGMMPNRIAFLYAKLERYGIVLVVLLLSLGLIDKIIFPLVEFCGNLLGVTFQ